MFEPVSLEKPALIFYKHICDKMEIQMIEENKPNIVEKPDIYDLMTNEIERILVISINEKDKKGYLLKALGENYGEELAKEIVNILPDDIFNTQTITEAEQELIKAQPENENIDQKQKDIDIFLEQEAGKIYTKLETFPEEERPAKLEEILENEYGVSIGKVKEIKKSPNWKRIFKLGVITTSGIAALMVLFQLVDYGKKRIEKNKKEREISIHVSDSIRREKTKQEIIKDLRFKEDVYESLPEKGKEVYKYMADEDPTPGRGYQFLDKDNAQIYVFNKDNLLINKINAGYGKDEGDEPNTSFLYNEGKMTTPSGIYLLSNYAEEADIEEYGKLQFSLYGISILGDKVFLGEHQTYSKHGELEPRTEKLESATSVDNKFSNGCVNVDKYDFQRYVKPYFKGDFGEFFFILPDGKSRINGIEFNVKKLIQKIKPIMIEMADKEEKVYNDRIEATMPDINKITSEVKTLEKDHMRLAGEYQKDKSNNSKQIQIENIKKEIKRKKEILKGKVKILNQANKKLEEIKIKRDSINSLT
jgi:hypothetical protein